MGRLFVDLDTSFSDVVMGCTSHTIKDIWSKRLAEHLPRPKGLQKVQIGSNER